MIRTETPLPYAAKKEGYKEKSMPQIGLRRIQRRIRQLNPAEQIILQIVLQRIQQMTRHTMIKMACNFVVIM